MFEIDMRIEVLRLKNETVEMLMLRMKQSMGKKIVLSLDFHNSDKL